MQTTFGAHLLALDEGQPREFDLKEMLEEEVLRRARRQ